YPTTLARLPSFHAKRGSKQRSAEGNRVNKRLPRFPIFRASRETLLVQSSGAGGGLGGGAAVVVAGRGGAGGGGRRRRGGVGAFGAAHAVDEQAHRASIEIAGVGLVAELVGRAASIERLLPERTRGDQRRVRARHRDQVEPAQRRLSVDARIPESRSRVVEER